MEDWVYRFGFPIGVGIGMAGMVFWGRLSGWLRVCSKGRALLRRQMRGKWKLD